MRTSPCLTFLLLLASASAAFPDSLWTKSGERLIGEVTEEGENFRVKTALVPGGILVPKSTVVARYPAPQVMLREIEVDVETTATMTAGVGPSMKDVKDIVLIMDEKLDRCEARVQEVLKIYPDEESGCAKLRKRIADIRQVTAAAAGPRDTGAKAAAPRRITPADEVSGTFVTPPPDIPEPQLFLRPPAGTDTEKAAVAARTMEKRLSAIGFEGIEVAVVDHAGAAVLKISSRDGLARAVRDRIRWFGHFRGRTLEGRIEMRLSPGEAEVRGRPGPDSLDKVKPPPGSKWWLLNAADVVLLKEGPVTPAAAFRKPVASPDSLVVFELPPESCKALREAVTLPKGSLEFRDWAFVLDGHAFRLKGAGLAFEADRHEWMKSPGAGHWETTPGAIVWARTGMTEAAWAPIRIAVEFPMEFELNLEE